MNPYLKENLNNWISEFGESDLTQPYAKEIRSGAPFFLQELLMSSVEIVGELENLNEKVLGEELMSLSKKYECSDKMLEHLPSYVGDFFEDLEVRGRFATGQELGNFVRTFSGRLGYKTITRPGAKIGRNDPCPCGSGVKYKKCCQKKG